MMDVTVKEERGGLEFKSEHTLDGKQCSDGGLYHSESYDDSFPEIKAEPFAAVLIDDVVHEESGANEDYTDLGSAFDTGGIRSDPLEVNQTTIEDAPTSRPMFCCDLCGKAITTRSNLRTHMRVHTNERPFECPLCVKTFIQRSHLSTHIRRHRDNDGMKCNICGEAVIVAEMRLHMQKHKKTRVQCHKCTKTFGSSYVLTKHIHKAHSGEKPIGCDQCSRRFLSMSKLLRHLRFHTGERPYKCLTCGRSFSENSTLKSHVLIHNEKRPYPCEHCGKSFTQNTNLTRHKRIHTGDKPFECNLCDRKFSQKSNLTTHKQTHIMHSLFS